MISAKFTRKYVVGTRSASSYGWSFRRCSRRVYVLAISDSDPSKLGLNRSDQRVSRRTDATVLHRPEEAPQHFGVVTEHDDHDWRIQRRQAILAGCGAAALWSSRNDFTAQDDRAGSRVLERVESDLSLEEAHYACANGAAVCATLYSQLSSTIREMHSGFLTDKLFQEACARRLGSRVPMLDESLMDMEEALPVIGLAVSAQAAESTKGWLPRWPETQHKADQAHFEAQTLLALHRSRRVQRLAKAMQKRAYTPAGVQLVVHDLKELLDALDTLLAAVSAHH